MKRKFTDLYGPCNYGKSSSWWDEQRYVGKYKKFKPAKEVKINRKNKKINKNALILIILVLSQLFITGKSY